MEASTYQAGYAGRDFEQWMDWSGEAGSHDSDSSATAHSGAHTSTSSLQHSTCFSISPPTTTDGNYLNTVQHHTFESHASNLPTPSQSSSSPEVPPLPELRLSGDTLRETPPVSNTRPFLKRKFSPSEAISVIQKSKEKPASKKRPHNVIEKRYRANLNEKIAELRDSVPSLRLPKKQTQDADASGGSEAEDLDGLTPTNKLNKASILTKAVEYIRHLELRNRRLDEENTSLKERLHTLDKVLESGGNSSARAEAFTSDTTVEQTASPCNDTSEDDKNSRHPPQGLIPLPESWRNFRASHIQPQEHYGAVYENAAKRQHTVRKWPAKLMLGSLAGLMVVDGLVESNTGTDSKEKGLFGIPLQFLDGRWFLRSPRLYLAAFSQYCQAGGVLPLIKGFTALTILAFFIFAYLFNSKPPPITKEDAEYAEPSEVPSLASPIEVRSRAWLTSMQMLKLPHHSFVPEWIAVTSEWLRYTLRLVFGYAFYAWMTGRSAEDELARTKAWDIAIDAQLAGGDPEISRSRLVLTMFGAGTLARSPARLMLKALHCRVLLRNTGGYDCFASKIGERLAAFLAARQWRLAQQMHSTIPRHDPDALPPHLSQLLAHDCDDVLVGSVIQRAFNLMYGRPTSDSTKAKDALLDVVVEDHAVRSPLDAVASWWSSQALQKALDCYMSHDGATNDEKLNNFRSHLQSAIDTAPPFSASHTRALALHAAFFEHRRGEYKKRVLATLPEARDDSLNSRCPSPLPIFIDSSTPPSAITDVCSIMQCVSMMEVLDKANTISASDDSESDAAAIELSSLASFDAAVMSPLSYVPAYHTMQTLAQKGLKSTPAYEEMIEALTACTEQVLCSHDVEHVSKHERRRLSNDTGYESMEEGEAV